MEKKWNDVIFFADETVDVQASNRDHFNQIINCIYTRTHKIKKKIEANTYDFQTFVYSFM